jgi:hypothetical protein
MKRLNICGNRFGWLPAFLFVFVMLCSGSLPEALAQTIRGLPEYIYQQPVSTFEREGGSAVFTIIFAYGAKDADIEVDWFKDGVALSELKPVLQTYTSGTTTEPQLWNPYAGTPAGYLVDSAVKYALRPLPLPNSDADYMAVWKSELRVDNLTAASAGVYSARTRVGKRSAPRISSNEAHLSVVAADPADAMKIVSVPPSRSLAAPGSNPRPSLKLYADMKSQVSALFNTPFATATDADGFTYVADTLNHCIRRLSPGGRTTTVAGIDGQPLEADLLDASLNDRSYTGAATNRTAWAGYERLPSPGYQDGTSNQGETGYRFLRSNTPGFLNEPRFRAPEALTVSDTGVIYVADTGNHMIRGIRVSGGSAEVFSVPTPVPLNSPRGIVFAGSSSDPVDNPPVLYVMDSSNYSVKKLYLNANASDGSLNTSKGDPGTPGCQNIAGLGRTPGWQGIAVSATDAKFYSPRGIVFMKDPITRADTLYIADTVNHVIRQLVEENGQWTARTVVGFVGAKGYVNGVETAARLNFPVGLALDPYNKLLYFSEFGTHSLRRVNLPYSPRTIQSGTVQSDPPRKPWEVDDVAGSGYYGPTAFGPNGPQGTGKGDGLGPGAVFYYPAGISFNNDGSLMVADTNNHVIRKVRVAGDGEWLGDSSLVAGIVGHSGNRDFSSNPGFSFKWKKDALWMTDGPAVSGGTISGSLTDTLYVEDIGYQDAGVYALVVTNSFSDEIELPQSFVYVATAGDRPKFLAPGYRIVEQSKPNVPLTDLQKGMDVYVSADILPADQVTYQWQVGREAPNGVDNWENLSDELISLQPRLHPLLGNNDATIIRGSTTARLAISKFQNSLVGVLPRLRFRVDVKMRSEPTLTLDPIVEKTGMRANWTGAPPQTVAVVTSSGTLYPGMILSGSGFKQGTKITAVNGGTLLTLDTLASTDQNTPVTFTAAVQTGTLLTGTVTVSGSWTAVTQTVRVVDSAYNLSNLSEKMHLVDTGSLFADNTIIERIDSSTPGSPVLYLNKAARLGSGGDRQIYAAEDLSNGTGLSIRYPAALSSKDLSLRVNGVAPTETPVKSGGAVSLFLTAGSSAVIGNPTPALQWYRNDTPTTSGGTAVSTGTSHILTIDKVDSSHRGYYYLRATNYGASDDSKPVFLDVERPATLKVLSMNGDGGSTVAGGTAQVSRVVDKTKDPNLTLTVNVDASPQPDYKWSFVPAGEATPVTDLSRFNPVPSNQPASGSLSIANYPIDGDGVFIAQVLVSGTASVSVSWRVVVKALPEYVASPPSKVFKVGTLNVSGDSYEADLNEVRSLFLKADFQSPRTLPLKYRWRRDRRILTSGTNSLSVPTLSRADMGTYRLEVSNEMGTRVFGAVSGSEQPFPGNPAGWSLKASGKPSVTIQPLGKLLAASTPNLNAAFAGMVAAGPRAAAAPAAGLLTQPVLRVGNLGQQRLVLQVAAEGAPVPRYQWYRKTDKWPIPEKLTGAVSPIYVLPPFRESAGTLYRYYAEVTNNALAVAGLPPVVSEEILVRVEGPPDPVISAPLADNPAWVGPPEPLATGGTFTAGGTVTLSAAVTDKEAAYSYQWKVNGNQILGAGSQKLTLPNIDPGQAGSYTVVATGVAGTRESPSYAVRVSGAARRYAVSLSGTEQMRTTPIVTPTLPAAGFAPGTRVTISGMAPSAKLLQGWSISYTKANNETVSTRLPARAAQFVMPAADVSISPVLSRPYTGTYTGLLTLEAPWIPEDEWAVADSKDGDFFRPREMEMAFGKVRGLFTCSVSASGAVSGQIQIENRIMGFTTALDAEMRGTFRITTTLRGTVWNLEGSIAFNTEQANRDQDYVDNVVHLVLKDVLMATPPLIPVGQTLYCAAAGVSGAVEALSADIQEIETSQAASATPMYFTAAAYRETNGETKESSYGQAAVLSVQIRAGTGAVILRGYLANGTKVTASSVLGRAFITPQMEGPDVLMLADPLAGIPVIYPALEMAKPFRPTSTLLSGQATEALTELLLRRSTSQSFPIWLRGDSATAPVYGAMIFNGPRVYGSVGVAGLNTDTNILEYTPNLVAGYFYDSQSPYLANLPSSVLNTDQLKPTMTFPDSSLYKTGLVPNWPTSPVVPPKDVPQVSVDGQTGLLFGGMIETTAPYLETIPSLGPDFALNSTREKQLPELACTIAAVFIQRRDILPSSNWTPSSAGGYVGFIYRGKNARLEPVNNVLGSGLPTSSLRPTPNGTSRIEALRVTLDNQY